MSPFFSGRLPMASPFRPLLRFFFLRAAGGDEQIRTVDPLLARQVLSHLSYTPIPIALTSSPLAKAVSQVLQSAPHL